MKLRASICLLVIAFVHESTQDVYFIPNATHPDYPGYCYMDDLYANETFTLKVGTKRRRAQNCYSIECTSDYRLIVLGCAAQGTTDHCRVIQGDLSKPYPYCCNEYVC